MTQFSPVRTNSNGIARFPISQFYGSKDIIIQTNTERDSVYKIELIAPFSDLKSDVSAFSLSEIHKNLF